jgi:hypothetical protein
MAGPPSAGTGPPRCPPTPPPLRSGSRRPRRTTGCLGAAATSMTRTLVAVGGAQSAGLRAGLAGLRHLDDESGRVSPLEVDGLSCRGGFRLLAGTGEGTAHHDRPLRHRAQELAQRPAVRGLEPFTFARQDLGDWVPGAATVTTVVYLLKTRGATAGCRTGSARCRYSPARLLPCDRRGQASSGKSTGRGRRCEGFREGPQ